MSFCVSFGALEFDSTVIISMRKLENYVAVADEDVVVNEDVNGTFSSTAVLFFEC